MPGLVADKDREAVTSTIISHAEATYQSIVPHCCYIDYESYISVCETMELLLNYRSSENAIACYWHYILWQAATARRVFPDVTGVHTLASGFLVIL